MHLSKTNNTEEKALQMIHDTFLEYNLLLPEVICARQDEVIEVCNDKDFVRR